MPTRAAHKSPWAALIADVRTVSTSSELPTDADLARVARFFDRSLPDSWVSWVRECGSITGYGRTLLGLRPRGHAASSNNNPREDALDLLMLLRLSEPDFASDLLPIEVLPDRQLHCLVVNGRSSSRVVLVDLDRPDLRVDAAMALSDFVYDWRSDLKAMSAVVDTIVNSSDNGREMTLLRPDEWSTRRLCSQNVIVALLETRHNRDTNEHDVSIFAVATLTSFAPGAATRWALTTILTEAHQAGGSLAVNFVRRSRTPDGLHPTRTAGGQRIPSAITKWAGRHGVRIDARENRWGHDVGQQLLLAATQLPESLRQLLAETDIAPETVCAAITTGTWPALDVEVVLRWADEPRRILAGSVSPTDRLRYLADQQVVRSAIVMSSLLRHLQHNGQASASLEDDTTRDVHVHIPASRRHSSLDRTLTGVTFIAVDGRPLTIDWPKLVGSAEPSPQLTVHFLAVESDRIAALGPHLVNSIEPGNILVISADAAARQHEIERFLNAATLARLAVLVAPDYTTTMDVAIAARLDRARMSRQ